MKIDKFIGILLVLFLLFILSWFTQPDFRAKNPALAELLGFTGSTVKKTDNYSSSAVGSGGETRNYQSVKMKIVGASVSFDGSYSQVVVFIGKNSPKVNLVGYFLKTSNGSYALPNMVVKAGDYVILTSNSSQDGAAARKISSTNYEVYLLQRILSPGNETAELYSSAGVLVSRYSFGSPALF
jgi:hypothetical protein